MQLLRFHQLLALLLSADLLIDKATLVGIVGLNVDKVQGLLAVLPLPNTLTTTPQKKSPLLDPAALREIPERYHRGAIVKRALT